MQSSCPFALAGQSCRMSGEDEEDSSMLPFQSCGWKCLLCNKNTLNSRKRYS
jgi:hypothetical protein